MFCARCRTTARFIAAHPGVLGLAGLTLSIAFVISVSVVGGLARGGNRDTGAAAHHMLQWHGRLTPVSVSTYSLMHWLENGVLATNTALATAWLILWATRPHKHDEARSWASRRGKAAKTDHF